MTSTVAEDVVDEALLAFALPKGCGGLSYSAMLRTPII
jgi:hypothetical protein